jgi:hypothetical protein
LAEGVCSAFFFSGEMMIRKLAFVIGGVAAGGVAVFIAISGTPLAQQASSRADSLTAYVLSASDSGQLRGPRQPIFFRHDIHAGLYKMQCQYCHYSVEVSPEPGIPSLQTCMGCHLVIGGRDSSHQVEIRKLRQAWTEKKPVEWLRVHYLPRHAHFPHQRHIKALGPNACATCHGDVQRMPQGFKVNDVDRMGFCVTCHTERNVSRDCSVCHY